MFVHHAFLSFSFWALAISAALLQNADDQTIGVSTALNLTSLDLSPPLNASTEDLDASSGNDLQFRCDGATYGFNPSLADCEGARSYFVPDSEQLVFGERHTGLPDGTFPLPYLVMGDKAECFFQIKIVGDGPTGRASLNQVRSAASALFLRCASNAPTQGGIVTNIGGDNNLAVIMAVFKPNVQCRGHFQIPHSCRSLLADMPASNQLKVFGPHDTPHVTEILPQEVTTVGGSDITNWYQIWEATEATFAVCGRHFKGGSYRGLGLEGNLFLTLGSRPPTVSKGNSSDDATA